MTKNPALLRKRLNTKETQIEQKNLLKLSGVIFAAGFIVAGLNFRFEWFRLPVWVSRAAAVFFLLAYLLYDEVLRENAFLSRTIEIQGNQSVIDTGLYGIVQLPMYRATMVLFLSMPLVLGSSFSFIIFLIYPLIIVRRIKNEENMLAKGLAGYVDYKKRVKYKIIPFIW